MNSEIIFGLVNNAVFLLALGVLYEYVPLKTTTRPQAKELLIGLIIGVIGIALMLNPWHFAPGVTYDTRSILLSIAGFFFGLVPTLVAIIITSLFRLYQGGTGVITGISIIILSAGAGYAWGHFRRKWMKTIGWLELYLFGIVVHLIIMICMMIRWLVISPFPVASEVVSKISLPVMIIYPIVTVLLGKLLARQQVRKQLAENLSKSERRYRRLFERNQAGVFQITLDGRFIDMNDANARIFGYESREEMLSVPAIDFGNPLVSLRYNMQL